jgi:hypothetical protein
MWLQATEGETAASGLLVSCISHKLHGKRLLVVSSAFDFDSSATQEESGRSRGILSSFVRSVIRVHTVTTHATD